MSVQERPSNQEHLQKASVRSSQIMIIIIHMMLFQASVAPTTVESCAQQGSPMLFLNSSPLN